MEGITKAVIPVAGLGSRFLPLSKVLPKEFFPLVDKPLLQYALEELKASGVTDIVFIVNPRNKKAIGEYFRKDVRIEKALEEHKRTELLEEMQSLEKLSQGLSFSYIQQINPLGDGHAVLQAQKLIGDNPCFVLYPDDVIESPTPCSLQLAKMFKTAQKPILALYKMQKEKLPAYGVVGVEKIARRFYKVKKIIEKPSPDAVPSDLALVGRRILTPEVFSYLKKARPNKKGEIVLSEVLGDMAKDGTIIYGYEIEGRWWECGNKKDWIFSNVNFALKHSLYGKDLQKFLHNEKLV